MKQKQKTHFHKFTSRLIEFSDRQVNRAMFVMLLIATTAVVINIPNIMQYFTAQPSEAFSSANPNLPPLDNGVPVPWDKAPWGTGPSDVSPDVGVEKLLVENAREPRIHNNRVVYRVCSEYDIHGTYTGDIYMKDLNTDPTQTVAISTAPGMQSWPAIFDHYIVWTDSGADWQTSDIHLYDLTTYTETNISDSPTTNSLMPAIYGHRVVWIDRSFPGPSDYKVMLYDIDTGTTEEVDTSGAEFPWAPDIFENTLVWENLGTYGEPVRVWIRDLNTGSTKSVSTYGYHQANPRIYGSWVVWVDYRHNQSGEQYNTEIYGYNISTPQARPTRITYFTDLGGRALSTAIYRDVVVWSGNEQDHYYQTFDVWAKKLSSLTSDPLDTTRLTIAEGLQIRVDVFANKVVWEDYRNGNVPSIYMFTMWQ
ncbi:hypothetical protein KJ836_01440 [Patescibacteria group bacterium]|nr:hypothetical protein [Patescibacteria group bacterium]